MWNRINYDEWANAVPYVAFFLTFGVFLILAVRAALMRRTHAEHMASLPLEDPSNKTSTPNCSSHDV